MSIDKLAKYFFVELSLAVPVLILNYNNIGRKIVKTANKYVGIREIGNSNNTQFSDPAFEHKLKMLGWQKGWSWCNFFVKQVLLETFALLGLEKHYQFVWDNFSPSTQTTWNKIVRNKVHFVSVHSKPKLGDVVLFRKMNDNRFGHAGIVEHVDNDRFISIEGNLYNSVAKAHRFVVYDKPQKGLWLLGFVRFKRLAL